MEENGVHVAFITADALYDDTKVLHVQVELERLLETQPLQNLVLDFAHVRTTGSAGLSMLMRLRTKCDERGCQLGLCAMDPTVREVLEIAKLDGEFEIRDSARQFIQEIGLRP
jgi:anti-anti-sigma factor